MTQSDRLRTTGWTVLALGLVAAAARYWILTRDPDRVLDDTTALGYRRSLEHGVGVLMGRSGALLTDVSQLLTSPIGEALIIVACAALFAGYFFRVAWVIEHDARARGGAPR
jgi:hypothetical protein